MKSMTLAAAAALLPLLLSNDALAQCEGCQNEATTRAGRSSVQQDQAPAPAPKRRARGERGTRGDDRPQDGPGARPPREGEGGDGPAFLAPVGYDADCAMPHMSLPRTMRM